MIRNICCFIEENMIIFFRDKMLLQGVATMYKDVSIEIIQKCFNQCLHCSSCSSERSVAKLSLPVILQLIADIRDLGFDRICLSGGEPLLYPNIVEVVQAITNQNMRADIYSCGIIEKNGDFASIPEETLSLLKRAGLKAMIFNLPSIHSEVYDLITQSKNRLPLVLKSIEQAILQGISAEVHFVPMKLNINEAMEVVEYAKKANIQQVSFLKLMPHGRALENIKQIALNDDDIMMLQRKLLKLKREGSAIRIGLPFMQQSNAPPCHAVREKLYIRFDGCVFGCEAFKYITHIN